MAKILQLTYLAGYHFANQATPPKFVANPGANRTTHAGSAGGKFLRGKSSVDQTKFS